MKVPTIEEAKILLEEASSINPGQWVDHSIYVARAAEAIASLCNGMDPKIAYVMGLLHGIGRRAGRYQMRHIVDGYEYMTQMGFDGISRICMTHSFPYKDTSSAVGKWDCTLENREFIDVYLSKIEYDDYDKLIQLCDYLALPTGFCLVEKRMIDVALRYGTNDYSILKWKSILSIKQEFEDKIGCSVYSLLPGVVENSLGK